MNSPAARSYPKRQRATSSSTAYSRRKRRTIGVSASSRLIPVPSNDGKVDSSSDSRAAPKWTQVLRYPTSPLDEMYFGSSPRASFQVPMWVRVEELTEEERVHYEQEEKKREEQRSSWKKASNDRHREILEKNTDGKEVEDHVEVEKSENVSRNQSIPSEVAKVYEMTNLDNDRASSEECNVTDATFTDQIVNDEQDKSTPSKAKNLSEETTTTET